MLRFIILTLLLGVTSAVSAECKQSDLAGRWEINFTYSYSAVACKFYIDEGGEIERGGCRQYRHYSRETRMGKW